MKKIYVLLLLVLVATSSFGQSKKLDKITEFELRNSGSIIDKENNVNGYYFFYLIDKLKKGEAEYGIQILDNNLNEVALKKYISSKHSYLIDSKFNNESLMFAVLNSKERKINLLSFDKKAEQKGTKSFELSKKEMQYLSIMTKSSAYSMLYPVPNRGFIFNILKDNKKLGYATTFVPTDGSQEWTYGSPKDSKEFITASPIAVNEKFVVLVEAKKPGMLSSKLTISAKILDAVTGKLIATKEYDAKNPKLFTNAFLDGEDNLVLVGEYFKADDNVFKDKSMGLFVEVLDQTGTTIKEKSSSWKDDIDPLLADLNDDENYYIYFHDVIPMANGHYYAIGEKFKKTLSAGGMASAVLSGGRSSATQLTITDAFIFELDSDFLIKNITKFEKGKSRAPSVTDFGSPQLNAHAIAGLGGFDHEYTQIDKENDRFYACFIDYERIKGEKNKTAFKTIIYDDGEFSQDKIYLDEKGKITKVFPAKIGNVVIFEYDRKKKELNIRMEKLNIN